MSLATRAASRRLVPWLTASVVACALAGPGRPAEAACTVSLSSNVAFGAYDVFGVNPHDSAGQIRWRCDIFTFPTVRVTITRGGSTTFRPRRMSSGAAALDYNLYLDAARTAIWGDETEGTQAYYQRYWGFGWITVTVYGRIPPAQDASVGTYGDSLTIVVNY